MKSRSRSKLGAVLLAAGMLVLTACGGKAPAPDTPAPAPAPAPAQPETAAPEASGPSPEETAWKELREQAKTEGRLVINGPGIPPLRQGVTQLFEEAYGIPVEYLSMPTGEFMARAEQESKANSVSIDVFIGGASNCYLMSEKGQIADATGVLIDPSLFADPKIWRDGAPRMLKGGPSSPADFKCGLQMSEYALATIFINPSVIAPDEIKSWQDLLKPQYKGKIAAQDPRNPGPGQPVAVSIFRDLGADYIRDLYVGQQVTLATDHRQLAEWVARGVHPIGLALVQSAVEPLKAAGLPLERIYPAGVNETVTGGFSAAAILKGAPHPKAAQLFVNWFASHEAAVLWEKAMMESSLRNDTAREGLPEYVIPKPGVEYVNEYDPDYFFNFRVGAVKQINEILGR